MAILPFSCNAAPLTANGLQSAMDTLGIDAPTLWAMLHVETTGCGYFASRRPQILFERHIFSQLTGGVWDAGASDVSNPVAGGYGPGGDFQYTRLAKAFSLNPGDPPDPSVPTPTRDAALKSASWGLGQVLGLNAIDVGFPSVLAMVSAMAASEDQQLQAVVGFIRHNKLQNALQNKNWAGYASVYNGEDYAKNQYDVKLQQAYTGYQVSTARPDLTVRSAQLMLYLLGFDPQGIDGSLGANTLTALHNFQSQRQLALTPSIDAGVLAVLSAALSAAPQLALA